MPGRPQTFSSARPTTSAAGRPTTASAFSRTYDQGDHNYDIEEEEDEYASSDDGDVFAFLPPTTAEQQEQEGQMQMQQQQQQQMMGGAGVMGAGGGAGGGGMGMGTGVGDDHRTHRASFAHDPFARHYQPPQQHPQGASTTTTTIAHPQYPNPAFDPWSRYQPEQPTYHHPYDSHGHIQSPSQSYSHYVSPGTAVTTNTMMTTTTGDDTSHIITYSPPEEGEEDNDGRQARVHSSYPNTNANTTTGNTTATIPSRSIHTQPPVVGPPPLSPPSPSTDSVPSTGIPHHRSGSGSVHTHDGETYRLRRISSTTNGNGNNTTSNVGTRGINTEKDAVGGVVKVSLSADDSSDTAASEKDMGTMKVIGDSDQDEDEDADRNADVEAGRKGQRQRRQRHHHRHSSSGAGGAGMEGTLTHRRQGKKASIGGGQGGTAGGSGGTAGSRGTQRRNPNAQPYWAYAENARQFHTLYGPSNRAVSSAAGTLRSGVMTADDSTAGGNGAESSYIGRSKRDSVADSMSMTHSMMEDEVRSEASIKLDFDFEAFDEEDSPFPEVRASVSNIDDPDMPAMTLRMWLVGLVLCISSSALNVFFNFRYPAPTIVPLALLLISYPLGKFLAFTLPITTYRIPLPHLPRFLFPGHQPTFAPFRLIVNLLLPLTLPRSLEFSFNPGPWNIKEHVLVFIMANVAVSNPYALNAIVVSEIYYKIHLNYWFSLTFVLATQLTGFGLAGMCRRFLVWPASMVWPQNLVACTLLNTLHAEDEEDGIGMYGGPRAEGKGMSRYRFFIITAVASGIWFFLPGYLFQALSFFSFVCWAAPNNIPLNQVFGVRSGLGMGFLTFDWTQISYVGSPMMVPWWAQVHVFAGFVLFYWILTPILYYTNSWSLAHFPLSANQPYDRFGKVYDIPRVLRDDDRFDEAAYNAYSPLYLPATYAMTYLLAFALSTCVIVHTALYHGKTLINGFKKIRVEADDIHAKLMRNYPEVPDWWYACVLCIFFSLAIVAVEVWDTSVPVWALVLSVLLPIIYVLPSGFIYAMTGQTISLNILAQIVPGTLLPGSPFANMVFKAYSVQTLSVATYFVQDLKLGHYVKVPPRATFMVQLVCTTLASFIQVGVKQWIFDHIPNVCSLDQPSQLICPHNQVFYTASAVWGLIGPARQFGTGSIYHPHLYAIVVGVFLPLPFYFWQRRYPQSWVRYVSTPVVLSGVSNIPPATGINYSSWFFVGFLFQFLIRKKNFAWWSKFNYVLSSALDSGTVIALILVFFTLQLPGGRDGVQVDWWGNRVHQMTADWNMKALLPVPPEGLPWKGLVPTATSAIPSATVT